MTIKNQQVKLLMKKLKKHTQEIAAVKSGMDVKSARKYIRNKQLPSDTQKPHTWKTRHDVFSENWDEIKKMLEASPKLQAKTILAYFMRQNPERYNQTHLRTLYRRVRDWRSEHGASHAVIFNQDIKAGKQSQSDWTCMNSLKITINGQSFKHLVFHFMLPYSHWESIYLCFSESFETLTLGYEKAVWEIGCLPREHRTDNLTAATHATGSRREFTDRWQQFMEHYGVIPTTNNVGVSHENGSVEKSHDTFKNAVDQELMLRGSKDFSTQAEYVNFLEQLVVSRNSSRKEALLAEMKLFIDLPDRKFHSPIVMSVRVSSGSVVQILSVPYTVPSRLIHYTLKAYIYPNEIILFYGAKKLQAMPRAKPDSFSGINYQHLIDSLIRKPAAFANYRYHEAMFPRLCFRKAYEVLRETMPANADKQYLKILQLAKLHSEHDVTVALKLLLEERQLPTSDAVKSLMDAYIKERADVTIQQPMLTDYDTLLTSSYLAELH